MEGSVDKLRALGHEVVDVSYPVDAEKFLSAYVVFAAKKLGALRALVESKTGESPMASGMLTRYLASNIETWARLDPAELEGRDAYLDEIPGRFEDGFADVDLIMSPVSPLIGIKYSEFSADKSFDLERANLDVAPLKFTGPVNFAGNPAMSVPLSWNVKDGLPAGTHFIAGVGLDWIAFPLESKPSEVSAGAIQSLGLLNLSAGLITIAAIWVFRYYRIDREVQLETRQALLDR